MKDDNNLITEEQVNRVAKILHLGKLNYAFTSIVIMKCPFNRKCKNEFMVNLFTGKYHCKHCGREGYFPNLALDLSLCLTPTSDINRKYRAIAYEFYNKYGIDCIDDIIVNAQYTPTWILSNHIKNKNKFCLLYFIDNKDLDMDRQEHIALKLMQSFNEYKVDRTIINIGKEYVDQYEGRYTNELYYYKLLDYSQQQLDEVNSMFIYEVGNNYG